MKIHFEVQRKSGIRSDDPRSVKTPQSCPVFVLNYNDNWNDYGYYTWFSLFYVTSEKEKKFIGELKLMHNSGKAVYDVMDKSFGYLSDEYCSLGINVKYYQNLRRLFSKDECQRVLAALQDCSLNLEHYERYKDTDVFKSSLYRDLSSERARREAKYIIAERPLNNAYSIDYVFHPKYNIKTEAPFRCKFSPKVTRYFRCVGIIGENGVGKTTMLSNLVDDLINNREDKFRGDLPLFSCVMSICTTPYDSFKDVHRPEKIISLPYYYFCAGQQMDETEENLEHSLHVINKRTFEQESVSSLYGAVLRKLYPIFDWNCLWIGKKEDKKVNKDFLHHMVPTLSSGELQLLLLMTYIFERINYDSLLVIDEPEVHLHPKAISSLFSLLAVILERFQSFCIVTTHSPLIVREIPGENVYMMRRIHNIPEIGKINIETLGEDISILYDRIFGYDDADTHLSKFIRKMIINDKITDYKVLLRRLNTNGKPVSLNTRFMVKQLLDDESYKKK